MDLFTRQQPVQYNISAMTSAFTQFFEASDTIVIPIFLDKNILMHRIKPRFMLAITMKTEKINIPTAIITYQVQTNINIAVFFIQIFEFYPIFNLDVQFRKF
eukprot:NODE_118_length_18285_cov_1.016606.p14 type:complete len:102 gc:universal NODE_118_length_18285_cov_1.016606:2201-2506(+)